MFYVAGGYAGAQCVRRDGEGGIDFLEVVGSSARIGWCWNVASRKGAFFDLWRGTKNICCQCGGREPSG